MGQAKKHIKLFPRPFQSPDLNLIKLVLVHLENVIKNKKRSRKNEI